MADDSDAALAWRALQQPELLYSMCSYLADRDVFNLSFSCKRSHGLLVCSTGSGLWIDRCLGLPVLREYSEQVAAAPFSSTSSSSSSSSLPSTSVLEGLYRALQFPCHEANYRLLYFVLKSFKRLFGFYRKVDKEAKDVIGRLIRISADSSHTGRVVLCVLGVDGRPALGFPLNDSQITMRDRGPGRGASLAIAESRIFDLFYTEGDRGIDSDNDDDAFALCNTIDFQNHLMNDSITLVAHSAFPAKMAAQIGEWKLRPLPAHHRQLSSSGYTDSTTTAAAVPMLTTSVYGAHGREVVFVADSTSADGKTVKRLGLKIIGDQNVPCNRLTFTVDLSEDNVLLGRDIDDELLRDPRPVTLCRVLAGEGRVTAEAVRLAARRAAMKTWFRGGGTISKVPLEFIAETVPLSYIEYHFGAAGVPRGVVFSLLWDDLGHDSKHLMDFYRYSLCDSEGGSPAVGMGLGIDSSSSGEPSAWRDAWQCALLGDPVRGQGEPRADWITTRALINQYFFIDTLREAQMITGLPPPYRNINRLDV